MKDGEILDGVKTVIDRHRESTMKAVSQMAAALVELDARCKELEAKQKNAMSPEEMLAWAKTAQRDPNAERKAADDAALEAARIGAMVADAVAKHFSDNPLQPGKDGLNATPEQIAASVSDYLKANPPKDGKDATASEVADALIKSDAIAPLLDLYAADAVAQHFAEHPVKHGVDGENATPAQIADAVSAYVKANPPKDGRSVTVEDLGIFMEAALSKWALEFERRANDTLTKAIDKIPEPKDGRDGVAMPTLEYDGKRTVTVKAASGEVIQVNKLAVPIHTGFWRDGMDSEANDVVTHDGNAWRALRDTKAKPCHENKEDWILFVRKGRDGRDFTDKPPTSPVKL
jgi:hypothetical protein